MTLVKSHNCTKCGGTLIVHNDLQQYECPYCSVFYDYEYFRLRDILDQAASSQKMLQYASAKEKYDFILKKDPHNFQALRGNLLCEAGINLPGELRKPERVICIVPSSLMHAEKMSEPDGKEYFHKLSLLREIARFIRTNRQQKESLENGAVKRYTRSGSIPLTQEERAEQLAENRERIQRFSKGFAQFYSQLEDLEPEEIKQEKLRKSSGDDVKKDEEKKLGLKASLSCTSCGGELIVNLNRQVYECPFCGMSFDYDFIRDETAISEAREALQNKQFIKADAIYEYIITVDPSNFEAHRGHILCAAKLDSLQSAMAGPELWLPKASVPKMKARVEEALAACEDCDRPYFEEFEKSISDFEAFELNHAPSSNRNSYKDRLRKELKDLKKNYEKMKMQYNALRSKAMPSKVQRGELWGGDLTPQEEIKLNDLNTKIFSVERSISDIEDYINESEEGISESGQSDAYTTGNIRQHLLNLIRFERVKSGEDETMDLSQFHDSEWEEE